MTSNFDQIQKTFIISGGRTGTKFFGDVLGNLIESAHSEHEPDILDFKFLSSNRDIKNLIGKNFLRLSILKFLGYSGPRNHSLNLLSKKISSDLALERFRKDRKWLPKNISIYIESNSQLFGLCEALSSLENTRVLAVVREPFDWIRSWKNKLWYSDKDLLYHLNLLGMKRLTPENVGLEIPEWKQWNRSSKLAWAWIYMNSLFADARENNEHRIKMLRFEDVFHAKDQEVIDKLLDYVTFEKMSQESKAKFSALLSTKINAAPQISSSENNEEVEPELLDQISKLENRIDALVEKSWAEIQTT